MPDFLLFIWKLKDVHAVTIFLIGILHTKVDMFVIITAKLVVFSHNSIIHMKFKSECGCLCCYLVFCFVKEFQGCTLNGSTVASTSDVEMAAVILVNLKFLRWDGHKCCNICTKFHKNGQKTIKNQLERGGHVCKILFFMRFKAGL